MLILNLACYTVHVTSNLNVSTGLLTLTAPLPPVCSVQNEGTVYRT